MQREMTTGALCSVQWMIPLNTRNSFALQLLSMCEAVAKRTSQQTEKGNGIHSNGSGATHKQNDYHIKSPDFKTICHKLDGTPLPPS